jgi:putative transposase
LKEAATHNQAAIHAYVLMTNHVHILVTPGQPYSITHMMQDLGRKYVRTINHTYQRTGTLWEGRYKASLIDSENYLLPCMRTIELNPVRASIVSHAGETSWSSYACNATGKPNPLGSPHPLYDALGNDAQQRQTADRELFRMPMDHGQIHAIREALNQKQALGREDFKDKIERMTKRQVRPGQPGRPRVEEEQAVYYVI